MPTNFVTLDYILTFTGMVVVVNLLTQFTKGLFDKMFENRTKWIVAAYSFILAAVAAFWKGDFSTVHTTIETIVIWAVNATIVWFTAMKAYETVIEKKE